MVKGQKKIQYPYQYDEKKRKLAKVYTRVKILSGVVNGIVVPILVLLAFFFFGGSAILKDLVNPLGILAIPVFILLLELLLTVIEFPLRFYSGYIYEHKYGLSRHSVKSWFTDYFKGFLIDIVLTLVLLTILYSFIGTAYWWIWAAVMYFFVDIVLSTVYPVFILPLFYKLTPYTDTAMKKKLLAMIKASGAGDIKTIEVAKESEKSVKANAMFAGWGRTKKMVLFDTLLDNFTKDEIETVIGHELGHYVQKDVWRDLALSTALLFPVFYIVHVILSLSPLQGVGDLAGLPLFLVAVELLGLLTMPLENWHSRWREREADWFGLEMSKKPIAQISTERRLADQALGDHDPHPFVEWLLFTHPSAEKRIQMVKEWQASQRTR